MYVTAFHRCMESSLTDGSPRFPGEANVRWLSVILGVLTVPAMWRFGSWAGGERVGQLAALALAISPFHRWISQEARAYVLYVLLATVALWLFFRAMSTNEKKDWALYALTSAAGVYSHYFFALLPLVAGLLLLFERRTWAECARGVWANVVLAAACVPAIGLLRADMAYQASYLLDAPFSIVTAGYAYFSMIAGFAIGPSLRELHSLSASAAVRVMLPWALAVGGAMLALVYAAVTGRRAQSRHAPRCAHHRTDRDRRSACGHRGRRLSRPVLRLGRDSDDRARLDRARHDSVQDRAAVGGDDTARRVRHLNGQPRSPRAVLERGCSGVRRISPIRLRSVGAGVRDGEVHGGTGAALPRRRVDRMRAA
jgi:hypothetical protein